MGFGDLIAFNQALLAKKAWRVLQFPEALVARVLKARYFKEESILSATCPATASYTYRSILHGRDLLREGLVWRIGDGSKVSIHHSNWIPRGGSMKPLGQTYIPGVMKVADLLLPDGRSWDRDRVREMFTPDDASNILQIVVGGLGADDYQA